MSREVPFDKDEICDVCGRKGAYDFMGDLICGYCLDGLGKDMTKDPVEREFLGDDAPDIDEDFDPEYCEHIHVQDNGGGEIECLDCGRLGYVQWNTGSMTEG